VLQRKGGGRVQFTNSDRLFLHSAVSLVSVGPQGQDGSSGLRPFCAGIVLILPLPALLHGT
jgi:hypothetical protein